MPCKIIKYVWICNLYAWETNNFFVGFQYHYFVFVIWYRALRILSFSHLCININFQMLWQVYKRISSLELSILGRISNNKGYGTLHIWWKYFNLEYSKWIYILYTANTNTIFLVWCLSLWLKENKWWFPLRCFGGT